MPSNASHETERTNATTTVERRSACELVVTRILRARPQIVFDAWTKPELLVRWWAPRSRGVTLFSCEADVRVGGRYRYVFGRDPKTPMAFSGVYREVVPAVRVVATQLYEQIPQAGEAITTTTFELVDGHTRLVLHQLLPIEGSARRRDRVGHGARHARDIRAARRSGRGHDARRIDGVSSYLAMS
jgi:uncharacterized protein YndB with AHSA1/START domain